MLTKRQILELKPSEWIKHALNDLEATERDERYIIDMDNWHMPNYDDEEHCNVCFGGSVMAKTFNCDPRVCFHSYEFGTELSYHFEILDSIANDACTNFLEELEEISGRCIKNLSSDVLNHFSDHTGYAESQDDFKDWVKTLISILESHGL